MLKLMINNNHGQVICTMHVVYSGPASFYQDMITIMSSDIWHILSKVEHRSGQSRLSRLVEIIAMLLGVAL